MGRLTWFNFGNELSATLPHSETAQGAGFLLVAYIGGHLISVFASLLDKLAYDRLRNIIFCKNNDYAFKAARQIKKSYVPERSLLEDIFAADEAAQGKKSGLTVNTPSPAEQKHVTYDDAYGNSMAVMNPYKWGLHFLQIRYPQTVADVKRLEADSKFFRSLVIAFLIIALYYFTGHDVKAGLILFGLSVLSFYRYGDLRYKSTNLVYELIITANHLK